MKIVLLTVFVALANADVSHLVNQQAFSGYPYGISQSNYGPPQDSVLGSSSYSSSGSLSVPQLSLPSISGPGVSFSNGVSNPSNGVSIQTYEGFSNPGLSGYQVSTPAPSVDLSSFQGSTPSSNVDLSGFQGSTSAPNVDLSSFQVSSQVPSLSFSNFQGSTPSPSVDLSGFQGSTSAPNFDLSGFQASGQSPSIGFSNFQGSTPAPSVDLSGFQASTPSSNPSVNLVQYSQPTSSSYQFLSKLSQPSLGAQFDSSAALNSGSSSFGSSNLGSSINGNSFEGQTSGGSLDESFGVATDATSGLASQASDVSKHLYFFSAPEDEEGEAQARIDLPAIPPKKTYKIIFIKAPTYRNHATITIPAQQPTEEKTLVYVLVKKPEGHPKVKYQDAAPTKPSKPEVFFIKYKTQKEAESAVAEIQSKHGASGQVIANLPAGANLASFQAQALGVSSNPSSVTFGSDASAVSRGSFNGISVSSTPSPVNYVGTGAGFATSSRGADGFGVSSNPSSINFGSDASAVSPGSFNGISASSTPSPVNFVGTGTGFTASSGSGDGLSFDSHGANSFAAPVTPSFPNRTSEETEQAQQVSGGSQQVNGAGSFHSGLTGGGATPGNVGFSQTSFQTFGGNVPSDVSNSASGFSSIQGTNAEQAETHEESGEANSASVDDSTNDEQAESQVSQNTVEQRVSAPSETSENQVGFSSYGPPKF